MSNKLIATKINNVIEDIAILFEKKERSYTSFKLNNQQYALLTLIIRNPETSTSELAEIMDVSKSAISQQLARLEAENYIIRQRDENDKRSFAIKLGEKGLKYKAEMEFFNEEITKKYNDNLSTEEMKMILLSLEKLYNLLGKM